MYMTLRDTVRWTIEWIVVRSYSHVCRRRTIVPVALLQCQCDRGHLSLAPIIETAGALYRKEGSETIPVDGRPLYSIRLLIRALITAALSLTTIEGIRLFEWLHTACMEGRLWSDNPYHKYPCSLCRS